MVSVAGATCPDSLTVGAQLITMNNNLTILDRAIQPTVPIKPRKMLSLAFGSLLGMVLGLATVLFMDYLDNTVRSPEDIEQYLGLHLLAVVPRRKAEAPRAVNEAFQSLRTSILFSSHNRERRVVLFTSAGPQEGKSSTVARALNGKAGKPSGRAADAAPSSAPPPDVIAPPVQGPPLGGQAFFYVPPEPEEELRNREYELAGIQSRPTGNGERTLLDRNRHVVGDYTTRNGAPKPT